MLGVAFFNWMLGVYINKDSKQELLIRNLGQENTGMVGPGLIVVLSKKHHHGTSCKTVVHGYSGKKVIIR